MKNEKPGGHGERSVAVGTIDMAIWDATAKIARKPLFRLLAQRHGREANPRVFVYAAGGYYYPGKGMDVLCDEMPSYLDRGYTVVKMKIGSASLKTSRVSKPCSGIERESATRRGCQRSSDLETGRLRQDAAGVSAILVRRARRSPGLVSRRRWPSSIQVRWRRARTCSAIRTRATFSDMAECAPTATGCSSIARCPTACANISARWRCSKFGLVAEPLRPARRSSDVAEYCRRTRSWAATKATRTCSSPMAVSLTGLGWRTAAIIMPDIPGIGFEGKSDLYSQMKVLAS